MHSPFSPDDEADQASQFKTLATMFEQPETMRLCERFSLLAVLSEEKAKILRELQEAALFKSKDEQVHGKLVAWTAMKAQKVPGDN